MEKRKSNGQKQDLDKALGEIEAILDKLSGTSCMVVLASADVWCGAIGGRPQPLSYAIKAGMNTKFDGQDDLKLLVELLNNK